MKKYAVITGDITNFTSLPAPKRKVLIADFKKFLSQTNLKPENWQIFRGDSYQILNNKIPQAIEMGLMLVCWFKMHPFNEIANLNTRLAIGIGGITYLGSSLLESDGPAFHLSGRQFDKLQPSELVSVLTTDDNLNRPIAIILSFINVLMNKWKAKQTESVYYALQGLKQNEIAAKMEISQSGVSNHLKLANWPEVKKGLDYIAELIAQ